MRKKTRKLEEEAEKREQRRMSTSQNKTGGGESPIKERSRGAGIREKSAKKIHAVDAPVITQRLTVPF